VVVEGGEKAVSLRDLFDDLVERCNYRHPLEDSVLTFESVFGIRVTIVASKSAGRYRIQSDSVNAINLLLTELEKRLKVFHEQLNPEDPISVSLKVLFSTIVGGVFYGFIV